MRASTRFLTIAAALLVGAHQAIAAPIEVDLEGALGSRLGESLVCTGTGVVAGAPAVSASRGTLPSSSNDPGSASLITFAGLTPVVSDLAPSDRRGGFGWSAAYLGGTSARYAVGAPFFGGGDGSVTVFGADLAVTQAIAPSTPGETFGFSLAELRGGDSTPELIVGAPALGSIAPGSVYVYEVGTANPLTKYSGTATGGRFGFSVAGTADLNGDGIGDVAVGAPNVGGGTVSVFAGKTTVPSPGAFHVVTGSGASATFGAAISGEGNITGDAGNVQDLIIGSPSLAPGGAGIVEVHAGESIKSNPSGNAIACRVIGATAKFGFAVANVGDYNGDGKDDFAVGAPDSPDPSGTAVGKVFIYGFTSPSAAVGARCTLLAAFNGDVSRSLIHLGGTVAGGPRCNLANNSDASYDFVAGGESLPQADADGKIVNYIIPTVVPTPTPEPTPAPPAPSIANVSFLIKRTGDLVGAVELDIDPPGAGCSVSLFGRVVAGPARTKVVKLIDFTMRQNPQAAEASSLPKVPKIGGVVPAGYVIAKVNCGGADFFSNIFGRLVNCGTTREVTANQWLTIVSSRLKVSGRTTKLLSRYGARMKRGVRYRRELHP